MFDNVLYNMPTFFERMFFGYFVDTKYFIHQEKLTKEAAKRNAILSLCLKQQKGFT